MLGGNKVAEWVAYDVKEFGPVDQEDDSGLVKRMADNRPEALVLMEPDELASPASTSPRPRRAWTSAAIRPSTFHSIVRARS